MGFFRFGKHINKQKPQDYYQKRNIAIDEDLSNLINEYIDKRISLFDSSKYYELERQLKALKKKYVIQMILGVLFLLVFLFGIIFLIFAYKTNKECKKVRFQMKGVLAPFLEKIDQNELTDSLFKKCFQSNKFEIIFGLNKQIKQIFVKNTKYSHNMFSSSYENIFCFKYNGYLCVITTSYTFPDAHRVDYHPDKFYNTHFFIYTGIPKDLSFDKTKDHDNSQGSIKRFYSNLSKNHAMDNPEFDRYCLANRDNEVQYRVLFSPLTQENIVNILKDNYDYGISMNNGILSFNSTKFPFFNIFHEFHMFLEPEELKKKLHKIYDLDFLYLGKMTNLFNCFELYKSPFHGLKNVDYGEDDIQVEEIEILLNNTADDRYLYAAPISGYIKVSNDKNNSNSFVINTNSYRQYTTTHSNGKDTYTEIYYLLKTKRLYAFAFNNEKTKISKYIKYTSGSFIDTLNICDVLEYNNHIIIICGSNNYENAKSAFLQLSKLPK